MNALTLPVLRYAALLLVGGATLANGALMLLFTQTWYGCITGASAGFSQHFVSDVGAIYVALGAGLVWGAQRPAYTFPLVVVALAFSSLHALLHVRDYLSTGIPTRHWLIEALGIWAPVALLGWLAAGTAPRRS